MASPGPGGGLPWCLWATGAKPQSLVAGRPAQDAAPEGGAPGQVEASTCSTISSQGASTAAALQALRRDCAGWRHEQTVHVDSGSSRACTGPGGGRYTSSEGSSGQCGPRGVEGTQPASEGSSGQCGPRGWKVHSVRGQFWTVRSLCVLSVSPLLWRGFQVSTRYGPGCHRNCGGAPGLFPLWLHHSEAIG